MSIQTIDLYNRICNVEDKFLAALGIQDATIPRISIAGDSVIIIVYQDSDLSDDGIVTPIEKSLALVHTCLEFFEAESTDNFCD